MREMRREIWPVIKSMFGSERASRMRSSMSPCRYIILSDDELSPAADADIVCVGVSERETQREYRETERERGERDREGERGERERERFVVYTAVDRERELNIQQSSGWERFVYTAEQRIERGFRNKVKRK